MERIPVGCRADTGLADSYLMNVRHASGIGARLAEKGMDSPEICDHDPNALTAAMSRRGRPARRCRSVLWEHIDAIERWRAEGYSYAQIACSLREIGHLVSDAALEKWARRALGRISVPRLRAGTPPTERTVSPASPKGEGSVSPPSMEELLDAAGAAASRPTKPKPKPKAATDPVADLLQKLK